MNIVATTKIFNKVKYWFLSFVVLTTMACAQHFAHNCAYRERPEQARLRYWGELTNTKMLRRFLGLRVIAADLLWIDLLYKSDLRHEGDFSPFYTTMRNIHRLDHQNYMAMWFGGLYLSVIKDDIKGASLLFRDAVVSLEQNPWVHAHLRGALYFAYGYHLLFEEQDFDAAAKYIALSAENPRASYLSKKMSESMSTERGIIEIGFKVLNDFYRRAKNDEERKTVEAKMKRLFLRKELLDLNQQYQQYLQRTDARLIPKQRAFALFLRSINHKGYDSSGRKLVLSATSRIVAEDSNENK
jgi:hypothetical protein